MEPRKVRRVESVALLMVNEWGMIYCVRELQAKPEIGKIPDCQDYSFPWETREPEENIRRTLHRLIVEEIDATDRVKISPPIYLGKVPVYHTLAYAYLTSFLNGPKGMRGFHAGVEIEPLGWQTREFLVSRCRGGVPQVLRLWDEHLTALTV